MNNFFQSIARATWAAALLILPNSLLAEDTQWSSFLFYEYPSKKIESNGVALKYRIAATGVRYDREYGRILANVSAGFAYNPNEKAQIENLAGNDLNISGPVAASYINIGADVYAISIKNLDLHLTLNSELFNFNSDNLTGWIGDDKVTGSVSGKMVNNRIGALLEIPKIYRKITAKTSLEYEFWQYNLDSEGSVAIGNLKAKSSRALDAASDDFSIGLALSVPFSNYELDLEYKTKALSNAQNARIQRFSIVYRF